MRAAGRRLLILLAATSVLFAAAPAAAGPPDGSDPNLSAFDQKLQDELRFRRDFGLTTDLATVRQLMADPTAYTTYPVALTPEESAEMERRLAMEVEMNPLEEAAAKMPAFAGHWIDQRAGGVIVVAFAGDSQERQRELQPLVPSGAELEVRNVTYTAAELEAIRQRIWDDIREDGLAAGIPVGHLSTDQPTNRVVVGVVDLTPVATAQLRAAYGEAVRTEPSNLALTVCQSRYNCYGPPLRAGVSGDYGCSIAFLVRHPGSGNKGWLTAGHCASVGQVWYHAGEYHHGDQAWRIGDIMANCWPNCLWSDAARADICCTALVSRLVYRSNDENGRNVTNAQGYNGDNVGDQVCLNAQKTEGWRCGTITDDDEYICFPAYPGGPCAYWFLEQRIASYAAQSGDSGGAVHSPQLNPSQTVIAYGVQSGCFGLNPQTGLCAGNATYSHIYRVGQELGVVVCSLWNPC